ncbi:MAG: hypothetical protein ACLQGV_08600 [Bryobacteraceae bacterium]
MPTVAALAVCTNAAVGQERIETGEPAKANISAAIGQERVEIFEPATVNISDLFKQADVVAVVRVLSGDSEHYPTVVYKARVLTAFKGARREERLYFGPFVGYGVGSEYLAFLRRSKAGAMPSDQSGESGLSYGPISTLYSVMYEGYSIMPIEYVCVFDGNEPKEQCGSGVKVNVYQVRLPKTLKTYPPEPDDESVSDRKWVKAKALMSLMETYCNAE